jgi:glycerol-3-phosphate acyltransferase PlsY
MDIEFVSTVFVIAYLLGSFPTAYFVGRLNGINIFEIGSGNMGANNTARALGVQWGLLVWLLDGFKGAGALLLARHIAPSDSQSTAMILAAIAVVLGHSWSIFATVMTGHIRGGKGAATASGTWLILVPPLFIASVLLIWALVVYVTRYMSLAVLTSMALISAWMVLMALVDLRDPVYVGYVIVTAMVFYRHRANIKALFQGTERRFGDRAKVPQ